MEGWVELGRFGRAHGVRGAIRFWPHNAHSALIRADRTIRVGPTAEGARPVRVAAVSRDAKGCVIRLDGIEDRDAAEALNGHRWFEARAAFAPLDEEDGFYIADLVGLPVRTTEGRTRGRLAEVWQYGEVDTYVVRGGPREYLIPAVARFIERVDLEAGEIVVSPDAGLLDDEDDAPPEEGPDGQRG